jgi:hypothetical protein
MVTRHFKYLLYVLRHKYFVFVEGRKLGVSTWTLIIHDWQKFTLAEWGPYVLSFYGPWKYKERPQWLVEAFDRAWLHHIHYGPHHWQYWLLIMDTAVEGDPKVLRMPDRYVREMLAAWRGAGRAITGEDNTKGWYLERRERFKRVLHLDVREWIEEELNIERE